MKNKKAIIITTILVFLFATGYLVNVFINKEITNNTKKVLLVVSPINFSNEEYRVVRGELEKANIEVKIASIQGPVAQSETGAEIKIDLLTGEVNEKDYLAVVFIGGRDMEMLSDDDTFKMLAISFNKNNKLVAAIENAQIILGKGGILAGKNATIQPGLKEQLITVCKAKYINEPVVVDGKIITAVDLTASEEFTKKIIEQL